jgi:hypothetical protein
MILGTRPFLVSSCAENRSSIVSAPILHFWTRLILVIELLGGKAWALVEREVQAEEAPLRVLKIVDLSAIGCRKLFATNQILEGLMYIDGGGDELPRTHGAAICQFDTGRFVVLDNDARDIDLRLERAAGGDEGLHETAREIE